MSGVHENSDRVPMIEADLSAEDMHELAMIRQEMLDACKGGEHSQLSPLEKKIDVEKIF